jgi:Transposase DDE domain
MAFFDFCVMNVKEILALIPEDKLQALTIETKVNLHTKKLDGITVFKLLLYSMITEKHNSLRVMENIFNSYVFKNIINKNNQKSIKHNSISERLSVIKVDFFEQLYQDCLNRFPSYKLENRDNVLRFDSTLLSVSSKLIDFGFTSGGGREHLKTLKFTVAYSDIPEFATFHHEPTYNSENVALKHAILNCKASKEKIVLFDRGIQARGTYDEFEDEEILFVSRINPNPQHKLVKDNLLLKPIETETLLIKKELIVRLINRNGKVTKNVFRYIYSEQKGTAEPIAFITNIAHLDVLEITDLYKKRWDIEVFFKFLKQELNFSHLISRSKNGIQVMLYVTMILAILLTVYKKKNKLKGFKLVKLKFANELEAELIKHIVIICGGNPDNPLIKSAFW